MAFCRFGMDISLYLYISFMIKIFLVLFFNISYLFACPNCVSSATDDSNGIYFYILLGFILLIYIPISSIFYIIIKNKNINREVQKR